MKVTLYLMSKKKLNIKRAIKRPGSLTRRAKRNGRSVSQQISADLKSGSKLHKQQARFARTLKSISKKRKKRASK